MTKSTTLISVISVTLSLFLQSTAQDEKADKRIESIPFLQSEADQWSFQGQMNSTMKVYMQMVETKAKKILHSRYKFDNGAKVSDHRLPLDPEVPNQRSRRRPGTLNIENGWVHNINKISLYGQYDMIYENPSLVFTSNISLFEYLKFLYEFEASRDGEDFNGTAEVNITDVRYTLKTALDIKTSGMKLLELRLVCNSEPIVKVDGVQRDLRRLQVSVTKAIADVHKGPIFEEVERAVRTVLEESLKKVSIRELLPKVDYKKNYAQDQVDIKKPNLCDSEDTSKENMHTAETMPGEPMPDLPFIRNTAEMWAFRKQLNNKMEEFMKHMSAEATNHLVERELRAKMSDDSLLISILDKTSTKRYAQLSLSNGWVYSSYKFVSSRVRLVGFSDKKAAFSAHVHLLDPVEFVQDFNAMFLRDVYRGVVKGSMKSMDYLLKFTFDLERSTLALTNSTIDCVGELSAEVIGLHSQDAWFSSAVKKSVLEDFHNSILVEIHKIVAGAFDYVASTTVAKEYIPDWNYARNYRWDLEFRISELDEDEIETCSADRVEAAIERSNRFLKMIDRDGTYTEPEPETKEGYYTLISGIKKNSIRYTSTKTQSWYLDIAMRNKMNEYVYHLLEATRKVILSQDLGTAKMPDLTKSLQTKGDQTLKIDNCWVTDLSSVEKSGVDVIEYDQKLLSLTTSMLVYKNLQFEGDYSFISAQNRRSEGKITAKIQPMIISFGIEIDYLNTKTSKVDYLKIECMGRDKLDVKFSPNLEESLARLASNVVIAYLKEKVIEDVVQVLRRALEDAILKTDLAEFIPEWDYKKDYITDIIQGVNQNRFQNDMSFCDSTEPENPSIELLYPDVETLDFSDFLPEIKTEALRRSFHLQIQTLMADGVNSMWRNLQGSLNRFNPPKIFDSGTVFELEEDKGQIRRYSLILNYTGFEGIASTLPANEIDFVYGKDDTITMLYKQIWEKFKVKYSFRLSDDNNTESIGEVVATAVGPEYIIKPRFFLRKSAFSVDEFFLHCIRNFTVTVEGLRSDWEWKLDSIKEQVTNTFTWNVLPEVKELLFILYGYATREMDTRLYTYGWLYYEELYEIAAENDVYEVLVSCDNTKGNENNGTSLIRGNIPFIGSEAEWWSFSTQMKVQVNLYMAKIKEVAKEFIRDHALQDPKIPDLHNAVSRELRGRTQAYNVSLTRGTAEHLMEVEFLKDNSLEFGEDLIITAYITFKENPKLNYDFSTILDGGVASGKIQAEAKSLKYKMVIRLHFRNKSARMTDFSFYCMSDLGILVTIPNNKYKWLTTSIPNVFRDDLSLLLQRDIKKIMHLSFNYGVITEDASRHVIQWNYRKDYRPMKKVNEDQRKTDFKICPSKSTQTPAPSKAKSATEQDASRVETRIFF